MADPFDLGAAGQIEAPNFIRDVFDLGPQGVIGIPSDPAVAGFLSGHDILDLGARGAIGSFDTDTIGADPVSAIFQLGTIVLYVLEVPWLQFPPINRRRIQTHI